MVQETLITIKFRRFSWCLGIYLTTPTPTAPTHGVFGIADTSPCRNKKKTHSTTVRQKELEYINLHSQVGRTYLEIHRPYCVTTMELTYLVAHARWEVQNFTGYSLLTVGLLLGYALTSITVDYMESRRQNAYMPIMRPHYRSATSSVREKCPTSVWEHLCPVMNIWWWRMSGSGWVIENARTAQY